MAGDTGLNLIGLATAAAILAVNVPVAADALTGDAVPYLRWEPLTAIVSAVIGLSAIAPLAPAPGSCSLDAGARRDGHQAEGGGKGPYVLVLVDLP